MIRPSRAERIAHARRGPAASDTPLGLRFGVLGKKWTLLILREVDARGGATFSQVLRAHHQLSRRILSMRLNELRREGYLVRVAPDSPLPPTAYILTQKGRDALPLLRAFSDLVRQYGVGVSVKPEVEVPADDVCFGHPEISTSVRSEGEPADFPFYQPPPVRPEVVLYKNRCEKCKAPLDPSSEAYICSYACTWCRACAQEFSWRCPNCQGGLQPRLRLPAAMRARPTEARYRAP